MLVNIDMQEQYKEALNDLGYKLEDICEEETDAGLGNGGLGRLAACFLDSMATLELPAWGYGIRYDYGIFKQLIKEGKQVEIPDFWLKQGNPWEIERADVIYPVRFFGDLVKTTDAEGEKLWCYRRAFRCFDLCRSGTIGFQSGGRSRFREHILEF